MNWSRLLRFGGGYGLAVVIGGVLSIAVIPIVIVVAGPDSWATIAVAQAVGGFAFVFVAAGWGVTGPTLTAQTDVPDRGQFYVDTLTTRAWLFLILLVPSCVIAVQLSQGDPSLASITVAGGLFTALSAGWFFVGEGSPIRFLLLETLPRNVATVVGAIALIVTEDAVWFVTAQLAGAVAATIISSINIMLRHPGWIVRWSFVRSMARLKGQTSAVAMAATAAVYVNLPIVIVQVVLPSATAMYALAERIVRLALYSTRPFVQVSQGYVPSKDPAQQSRRARRVVNLAIPASVVGGLLYAIFAPFAGAVLSGGELDIPFALAIPMGIALAAMLSSQFTGFACLTAFGLTRVLALSTIAGAVTAAVLLIPGALLFGTVGLAYGLAASELVVLIVQLVALAPHLRRTAPGAPSPTSDALS